MDQTEIAMRLLTHRYLISVLAGWIGATSAGREGIKAMMEVHAAHFEATGSDVAADEIREILKAMSDHSTSPFIVIQGGKSDPPEKD